MIYDKNFLITSSGRTGTTWLAHLMNRSAKWTVFHEPRGFRDDSYEKASYIFKNEYYGEVNGALWKDFHKFECKKAIIYRPMKEVIVSVANRHPTQIEDRFRRAAIMNHSLFAQSGEGIVIDFHGMVSDIDYLIKIFKYFGVVDFCPIKSDLSRKKNEQKRKQFNVFEDLPKKYQDLFYSLNFKDIPCSVL